MSDLKHIINLVIGDWSHDGHNMTETITVRSNMTVKQVEKAYANGIKVIGVDVQKDVCTDYNDARIAKNQLKLFIDAGFEWEPGDDELDENFYIDHEIFADFYLFTAKKGDPDFKHELVVDDSDRINIGGYGLLGS